MVHRHQQLRQLVRNATQGHVRELIVRALAQSVRKQLVPLRETTRAFLGAPRSSVEYNLYLQSISHIPFRTPESTHTVRTILAHVDGHNLHTQISATTYTRLIRPSFTPVALLAYLHHRLSPDPLPLPVLLSFLTVYSKLSDPSNATLFFDHIRAHPHTSPATLQSARTLLLAAQASRHAAYHLLASPRAYNPSPYNASASLHVLSKDLAVPTTALVNSFLRLADLPGAALVPLHTSLINGLILRKQYDLACEFFRKLCRFTKKSSLDTPALSAGINALTRAGNPHDAFQLLEAHYPRLLLSPPSFKNNPTLPLLTFLTALNRISRPDITTLLFFLYPALYGPSAPPPNAILLNLLLQAARTGIKMDLRVQRGREDIPDNIKRLLQYLHSRSRPKIRHQKPALNSLLSKLNFRTSTLVFNTTSSLGNGLGYQHLISEPLNPVGRQLTPSQSDPHPHPRLHASNIILTHLGHPSRGGLRQFTSSSAYQGIPSGTWARIVFLRVLAGLATQLWLVKAPAISFVPRSPSQETRPSPKLDSFTHIFSHTQTQDLIPYTPSYFNNPTLWKNLRLSGRTFYPSIIPTNSNFFNYLIVLALSSSPSSHQQPITLFPDGQVSSTTDKKQTVLPPPSTHEIPLVLAWMRELGIQTSKSTLAVALVLWGEVCARVDAHHGPFSSSPTVDRAHTGTGIDMDTWQQQQQQQTDRRKLKPGEHQYLVLVSYLREWVGEERLPHWKTLEKWRVVLRRMRAGGGDVEDDDEMEEEARNPIHR